MSILDITVLELGKRIQSGDITTVQAAGASLARIKAAEPSIHAYVTVNEEKTMEQAGRTQVRIEAGRLSRPLAGVPMAIKDNMYTEGMRITCSFRTPENFIPTYMAQAAANPEQAGAVILGKTNMDEFTMGGTTETSASGVIRNPWNPEHMPGGSSDGSYVTVAAGECSYALGSSTSGPMYQLSSFYSVTGTKFTYGAASRHELTAYGSSPDQIGPVAGDMSDYATVLRVLASHDSKDSTSMERGDCDLTATLSEDVRGIRIDISESCFEQGLDREVKNTVLEAARVLEGKGAVMETFNFKLVEYTILVYHVTASAEASSSLSCFDSVKYDYRAPEYEGLHSMYKKGRSQGFGPEVKRRTTLGFFVLSFGYYDAYCPKALRTKALIRKEFDRAFASYDVILVPAAPITAPRLGQSLGDPLKIYLGDIYTISVNLAGLPGISPPCGLDLKGLPVELQLIRDCFKEENIVWVAYVYEKTRRWELSPMAAGMSEKPSGVTAGEAERRMSRE